MACEFDQNNFRAVVEPERNDAVSETPADDHVRIFLGIHTGIVFWKQPLIWCNQPADQGQPELTAMRVPGEDQIHIMIDISFKQLRSVRKQDRKAGIFRSKFGELLVDHLRVPPSNSPHGKRGR